MVVMAARMHDSDRLTVVLRTDSRGIRKIDEFGNRKSVHVSAQGNYRLRAGPSEVAHDARVGYFGSDFHTESVQVVCHEGGGSEFTVAEFRMGMDISPPLNDAVRDFRSPFISMARRCARFGDCARLGRQETRKRMVSQTAFMQGSTYAIAVH